MKPTVGERSHKNADARANPSSGVVPPNSAPLPNGDELDQLREAAEEYRAAVEAWFSGVEGEEGSPRMLAHQYGERMDKAETRLRSILARRSA